MSRYNPSCLRPLACAATLSYLRVTFFICFLCNNLFFVVVSESFSFLHLFVPTFSFSLLCGLSVSQAVYICVWKSSHIPLVGFACVCMCFIQSCCGILKPFMACFLTSVKLWPIKIRWVEKGEHKSSQFTWMEQETRAEGKALWFPHSTIHILRPDEAIWVHLSPAVNSRSRPSPLWLLLLTENKQREPCILLE